MAQYLAAKAEHPDALLFFRMGDFYELFFEDAEKASAAVGIALTKRGQHGGEPIPMAGVPWRQAELYLARLIRAGFKVAVCDQMEDPAEARKRGSKAIVHRAVTRLVTPGTLTEEGILDARVANRLAAVAFADGASAIAWADVSTGDFETRMLDAGEVEQELAALGPSELLVADVDAAKLEGAARTLGAAVTQRPAVKADVKAASRRLQNLFEVSTLDGFGAFERAELSAMGMLLDYVELTQAGAAPRLSPPKRQTERAFVAIDPATRNALEIERANSGAREGSLVGCIDRTVTAAGSRLLAERICRPLTSAKAIDMRLDAVAAFFDDAPRRKAIREALRTSGDLARALSRLMLSRGGPRDLAQVRESLIAGDRCAVLCDGIAAAEVESAAGALRLDANISVAALAQDLQRALAADLPPLARDGGFIAAGYDAELDQIRALRDDSRKVIAALQTRYAEDTGIPGLKVKFNGVLGYHIEATTKQAEVLASPAHTARFIRRQTTAGSTRFTTAELAELDAKISRAGDAALARELALFQSLVAAVAANEAELRAAAAALAALDVAAAIAEWADEVGAVRPELDESAALIAEGARHPVVEQAVRREGQGFTPNDARLDADARSGARILIVTGPNMAGKSTYLRQIALLAILAQAGCFVPARKLRLGIVDRVFARVGASDDLARGRSTFMTEMVETAAILSQATPRSLVVLDEIGRGTATFDGLAIAWAVAEHLHNVTRCRSVFATHYHELTRLADRLEGGANAHLRAKEWKGDLIFLHEVAPGAADRSYGIQVAKLAGLPRSAIERARSVLARLESGSTAAPKQLAEEMPLFQAAHTETPTPLEQALASIDPNELTPKAALELLYRLKALLDREADRDC
jgi:DNA mismatch repair protein MutS